MSQARPGAVTFAVATSLAVFLPPGPARGHFPHDVVAEVAVYGEGADAGIAAQYLYPGRGLLVRSDDGGRSWAFGAPDAAREVLESLHATAEGTLFAADALTPAPWRSEDGGGTWTATSEPSGDEVWCAVPSPAYDEQPTVFACAGGDLFRSDDGGGGWSPVEGLPDADVIDVALAPGYPDDPFLVVLTGDAGVWSSPDDGASWVATALPGEGRATALSYSPGFDLDDRFWLGMSTGAVFRSSDRGETWSAALPEVEGEPLDQAIHDLVALDGDRMLAISADFAVLCSDDAGDSWALCDQGIPWPAAQHSRFWGHYRRLSRPAGGSSPVALAAWEGLVLGKEAGEQWSEACFLTPDYVRSVAFSPGYPDDPTLWLGTYGGGVHRSQDGGETWTVLAADKEHQFTEALVPSPEYPADPTLFVVTARRVLLTTDGGDSFRQLDATGIALAHDVVLSPGFADDGIAFTVGTTEDEGQWVIARSDDGGESWAEIWRGEPPPAPQIVSLLAPPGFADGGPLYGIQQEPPAVVRSGDGGSSWEEVLVLEEAGARLLAADGGLLAVTPAGAVWRGGADGEGWALVAAVEGEVVAARTVAGEGDESDAVFLSLAPPGLLRSDDGGLNWVSVPTPFSSIVLDVTAPPGKPREGTLLASTHYGTFATCDGGETWQLLGRLMRIEDTSCPVHYEGSGWERVGGGTAAFATRSNQAGDAAEVSFRGRAVRWIASRFPGGGAADVYADGELVQRVDLAATETIAASAVFEFAFAEDDHHTLRLEVVGDGRVELDALDVVRWSARNGPDETYDIGDWCIDLPDPPPDIVVAAACCPGECEQGERGGSPSAGVLLVVLVGWRALARRRR